MWEDLETKLMMISMIWRVQKCYWHCWKQKFDLSPPWVMSEPPQHDNNAILYLYMLELTHKLYQRSDFFGGKNVNKKIFLLYYLLQDKWNHNCDYNFLYDWTKKIEETIS